MFFIWGPKLFYLIIFSLNNIMYFILVSEKFLIFQVESSSVSLFKRNVGPYRLFLTVIYLQYYFSELSLTQLHRTEKWKSTEIYRVAHPILQWSSIVGTVHRDIARWNVTEPCQDFSDTGQFLQMVS